MPARLAAAFVLLAAAGCGTTGGTESSARTVEVTMRDVAFTPSTLAVSKGETVTFRFTNADAITHDAFIGDAAAQAEHEKAMRAGHGHAGHDAGAVSVAPGKTASLTHTFDEAGTVEVGCHEPGHYAGGMKMVVTVA